ncbi:hypothetical protein HK100_012715 [Physocladia obscura]|uniref:Uncharacterized protein n=1 Tax=Physocladia obscura TaxID=109957 RepID=A0AAD5T903_9FUNG|nr:hypothetical protein HK100_012715 [Physocladia obscura]
MTGKSENSKLQSDNTSASDVVKAEMVKRARKKLEKFKLKRNQPSETTDEPKLTFENVPNLSDQSSPIRAAVSVADSIPISPSPSSVTLLAPAVPASDLTLFPIPVSASNSSSFPTGNSSFSSSLFGWIGNTQQQQQHTIQQTLCLQSNGDLINDNKRAENKETPFIGNSKEEYVIDKDEEVDSKVLMVRHRVERVSKKLSFNKSVIVSNTESSSKLQVQKFDIPQKSVDPCLPETSSPIVIDLQSTITAKNQEIQLLRNVINGAVDEYEFLENSQSQTGEIGAITHLKAANIALRTRVQDLESILAGCSGIVDNVLAGTRTPKRSRNNSPVRIANNLISIKNNISSLESRTIETQTWDDSKDLTYTQEYLAVLQHENQQKTSIIKNLTESNASLRIEVARLLKTTTSASVFVSNNSTTTIPTNSAANSMENDSLIAVLRESIDSAARQNERLAQENAQMQENIDYLVSEIDVERRDHAHAIQQLSLKYGAAISEQKTFTEEQQLQIFQQKQQQQQQNNEFDPVRNEIKQLRVEVQRWKRESENLSVEFVERSQEFHGIILGLENNLTLLETALNDERENLAASEQLVHDCEVRIDQLESKCKNLEKDRNILDLKHCTRIVELENALKVQEMHRAAELTTTESTKLAETKLVDLKSVLESVEHESFAKRLELTQKINVVETERDKLLFKVDQLELELQEKSNQPILKPIIIKDSIVVATTETLQELETQNLQLRNTITSLNHDLEAINTRHFELTQKLKIQATEYETSLASLRAEYMQAADAADQYMHQSNFLQHQLEIQKDRFHASQAKSQSLLDALNRTESELARLRLSQAEVGNTLLMKGNATTLADLVQTLQARNDELATELMTARAEVQERTNTLEQYKLLLHEREAVVASANETRRELQDLQVQISRERENWALKERALYSATEKLQIDYQELVKSVGEIKKGIWDSAESLSGWRRGVAGERVEEVDILGWVKWMVNANTRLESELEDTHQILDLQHEKMESAIAMSSSVKSEEPVSLFNRLRGVRSMKLNDRITDSTPPSPSAASIGAWSRSVADVADTSFTISGYHSHVNVSPGVIGGHEDEDIILPLPLVDKKLSAEKMQATMKKLMSRNVSLQQKLSAIEGQLDHQIKTNAEIKRMFVQSTIGGIGNEEIVERYNDALFEVGELRKEVDHWRARFDEMETVVEGIVLSKAQNETVSSK